MMHPLFGNKLIASTASMHIATMGEMLMRFSPDGDGNWLRNNSMPVFIGGAELNVASALALWGVHTTYLTALPNNSLGVQLAGEVAHRGIHNERIMFTGGRAGAYYLPVGGELKSAGVIYDREGSAFALQQPGTIDWKTLLDGIGWLHITAISPALNQQVADTCKEALAYARSAGIITSIDLNYRAKLWQYGKQPIDIIPELAALCDVIMGNVWAAQTMLGIPVHLSNDDTKHAYRCIGQAQITAETIFTQFENCKLVANTYRFTEDDAVDYYAVLNSREETFVSKHLAATSTVDKSGSGDCFMAGLIYSLIHGYPLQEVINYAAASAFGKLQVAGDNTNQTVEQVKKYLA